MSEKRSSQQQQAQQIKPKGFLVHVLSIRSHCLAEATSVRQLCKNNRNPDPNKEMTQDEIEANAACKAAEENLKACAIDFISSIKRVHEKNACQLEFNLSEECRRSKPHREQLKAVDEGRDLCQIEDEKLWRCVKNSL